MEWEELLQLCVGGSGLHPWEDDGKSGGSLWCRDALLSLGAVVLRACSIQFDDQREELAIKETSSY